ncbi:MAG: hypothetical protein OXE95_10650 [Chloroflexi bacterium]|nr:hypothetical protein [Chloroflexota bacterium]MCY4248017.1 hypothetical protein [Chloroflexota bacterium]
MDLTTQQALSLLFVLATAVLIYTARFLQSRGGSRRALRPMSAFARIPDWSSQAIEADRPLHLAFGSASLGEDNTAIALANAELFQRVINQNGAGDTPPALSASAPATIPLASATVAAAWTGERGARNVHWYPQGKRAFGYAAGVTAVIGDDEPPAHILAGSFGAELGLILDSARRKRQATLAVSDQLAGQAVAYVLADEALIGEELFAAPAYVAGEARAADAVIVMDVWRALLMILLTLALALGMAGQLPWLSWQLLVAAAVVALVFAAVLWTIRRRR